MPVPKQKKGRGAVHTRRSANMKIDAPSSLRLPSLRRRQASASRLPQLWLLQGSRGHRYRVAFA